MSNFMPLRKADSLFRLSLQYCLFIGVKIPGATRPEGVFVKRGHFWVEACTSLRHDVSIISDDLAEFIAPGATVGPFDVESNLLPNIKQARRLPTSILIREYDRALMNGKRVTPHETRNDIRENFVVVSDVNGKPLKGYVCLNWALIEEYFAVVGSGAKRFFELRPSFDCGPEPMLETPQLAN